MSGMGFSLPGLPSGSAMQSALALQQRAEHGYVKEVAARAAAGDPAAMAAFVTPAQFWAAVDAFMAQGMSQKKAIEAAKAQLHLTDARLRLLAPELFERRWLLWAFVAAALGGGVWLWKKRRGHASA